MGGNAAPFSNETSFHTLFPLVGCTLTPSEVGSGAEGRGWFHSSGPLGNSRAAFSVLFFSHVFCECEMSSVTAAMSSRSNLCLPPSPSPQTVCFSIFVVFFSLSSFRLPAHVESVCLLHSLSSCAPFHPGHLPSCSSSLAFSRPPFDSCGKGIVSGESTLAHTTERCPHPPGCGALDTRFFYFL